MGKRRRTLDEKRKNNIPGERVDNDWGTDRERELCFEMAWALKARKPLAKKQQTLFECVRKEESESE